MNISPSDLKEICGAVFALIGSSSVSIPGFDSSCRRAELIRLYRELSKISVEFDAYQQCGEVVSLNLEVFIDERPIPESNLSRIEQLYTLKRSFDERWERMHALYESSSRSPKLP